MRSLRYACMLVLLVGCSGDAAPSRAVRDRGPAAYGGAGSQAGKSGPASASNLENPTLDISMQASAGGAAAPAAPAETECVVGKYCPPKSPDPLDCGTLTLEQDVKVSRGGNLLLVFDQSASMVEPWGVTGQTKLQAAQAAISNAINALQDSLSVGAIFFPTLACAPGPAGDLVVAVTGSAVASIDAPEQIAFAPAADFLQRWNEHWMMLGTGLGVGTPMQEAFDQAEVAIQNAALTGPLAVVAVTDGAPNCFPNAAVTGIPTAPESDRASMWLANKGIKTYVVGLPGAAGVTLLNSVAQSGGTMEYLLPDDPKALEDKLREVLGQTVKARFDSCSIRLTPAADPVDKLKLIVVEAQGGQMSQVPHMLSSTAGWTISADGTQVEITGELCRDAMSGRFSSLTFEYGCKGLPPLPPPPKLN